MNPVLFKINIVFGLFLLVGCNTERDYRAIIRTNAGIEIGDTFILENEQRDYAIGDYSESFLIKLDSVGMNHAVSQIVTSSYYSNMNNDNINCTGEV